jgi:hypothetical protein
VIGANGEVRPGGSMCQLGYDWLHATEIVRLEPSR